MRKFLFIIIFVVVIVAIAVFLYLKFYGKNIFEAKLSDVLGRPIRFESFALNLDEYSVRFENFSVPNRTGFKGRSLFNAAKVTVTLDKDKFNENKEILFKHIFIEKGTLHVERNREGVFNIAGVLRTRNGKHSIAGSDHNAYAEGPRPSPLYRFARNVAKVTIKDSSIEFKDYEIYDIPFGITFDDFNLVVISDTQPEPYSDSIPVGVNASFNVPSNTYTRNGQVFLEGHIDVYQYIYDINMVVNTQFIDIMQLYPYLENHTPFSVQKGLFSSKTDFRLQNNVINSLTTMVFHSLSLSVDPGHENAQFLRTSVNKLAPYLTSQKGDLIFDFTIKGPPDNPQTGVGPRVQEAMGMVALEEAARVIQGLQGLK